MVAVVDSDPDAGRCEDQKERAEASPQVLKEEEAREDQGSAHGPRQGLVLQGGVASEPHPESEDCRDDSAISDESGSGSLAFEALEDTARRIGQG